eukprot:5666442-Pyramimonas_sp.AAC.1
MAPRAMTLNFPFALVVRANHPSAHWAAREPAMRRERGVTVLVAPKFALDARGKITSISRASPQKVVVVIFSLYRIADDLRMEHQ